MGTTKGEVSTCDSLTELLISYLASDCLSVENTGTSWRVNMQCSGGSTLTGGPLGEDTYQLVQFHAHWGGENSRGSEHTVDGKMFPGEIHLVHFNTKYEDFAAA